jgi:hypothetical protein
MSLNTLLTSFTGTILETFWSQFTNALIGQFVGRNSSGAPAASQDLGTVLYPWGTAYITDLILNGSVVQGSLFTGDNNQIISGQIRSTSNLADFIRAAGSAATVTIQAATTNLVFVVNGAQVTANTDIAETLLTTAPSSNNTCLVNDTSLTGQESSKFTGEDGTTLTVDTVGSEISSRVGMVIALKRSTEIMIGIMETATTFTNAYRGFFFDSSGDPIARQTLSNNDTLTLMELGWIFLQNNGSTSDVSYQTPIISGTEPTVELDGGALSDGQYWLDLNTNTWKRHNGTSFVQINRTLVGLCVIDSTNCIGSRSIDFQKAFSDDIINELQVDSNTVISSALNNTNISVNGRDIKVRYSPLQWTMPTDLETGESESATQDYYVYLGDKGERKLSTIKYYDRPDLKGLYHPYNSWRCIGVVTNDGSSNFSVVRDYHGKTKLETLSNKTLITPTIADLSNATHDHTDNANGGAVALFPAIQYRLNTNVTNDDDPLGSTGGEWEIANEVKLEDQVGSSSVTESNGTFSFATTGYWVIHARIVANNSTNPEQAYAYSIKATDDNSAYSQIAITTGSIDTIQYSDNGYVSTIVKISNISNDKIRLAFGVVDSNTLARGDTNVSYTSVIFQKISGL